MKKSFKIIKTIVTNYIRIIKILISIDKVFFCFLLLTIIINGLTPIISVKFTQTILNSVQTLEYPLETLLIIVFGFIFFNIFVSLFLILQQYFISLFQYKIDRFINIKIVEKAGRLSLKDFENTESYNKIQRAKSSNRIYSYFSYLLSIIELLVTFISYVIILMNWKWWIVLVVILTSIINTILMNRINEYRYEMLRKRTGEERKKWYYQFLLTNDIAFKEIKIYNLSGYFLDKFKKIYDMFLKQDTEYIKKGSKVGLFNAILDEIVSALFLVLIILDTYSGKILIGDSVAYINVSNNVKKNVKSLLQQFSSIYNDNLYINQIFELLDLPDEKNENKGSKKIDSIKEIVLKDVSYKYSESEQFILKNISLTINENTLYSIVGENGSGKSTLIKIISGLYRDYIGTILINGINLKDIDIQSMREQISIFFQDYTKYELTLRENVSIGNVKELWQDSKIINTLKNVGFNKLNDLEQQLGVWFDNGRQLSGGEWIKIGIARAIFKNSSLVIFDEPDASLDRLAEKDVYQQIVGTATNKICIFVSHHLSSIPKESIRIVLKEGEIVGMGTHENLLKHCKMYSDLYNFDM